jgi:hypothetical protein
MRHFLETLQMIDFVTAWKAISIAFTGAFGILGLLTKFKDKRTHKITRWGWVSLAGIIVSSVCGVAAQWKEPADAARQELALRTDMQKTLSPLVEPEVHTKFRFDCTKPKGRDIPICHGGTVHKVMFDLSFYLDQKHFERQLQRGESSGTIWFSVEGDVTQTKERDYILLEMPHGKTQVIENSLRVKSVIDLLNAPLLIRLADVRFLVDSLY